MPQSLPLDNNKINLQTNRSVVVLLWILLFVVFLFSLFNLFVYLFVPVDGAQLWVRQGPVRVLDTSFLYPGEIGVQVGDVIVEIQNQDLDWWLAHGRQATPKIIQRINDTRPAAEMTVLRNGQIFELTVPLDNLPGGAARQQFLIHMFVGYAFLAAGVIILRGGKGVTVEHLAVLIMALMALIEQNELLLAFGAEWSWSVLWLFIPLRLLTRWFAYSSALHFSLLFPHRKTWLNKVPYLPVFIHLLNPAVTVFIMLSTTGNLQARHAAAYSPSKNIYIVYLLLTCIFLAHSYITAKDVVSKNQMRWIAWGVVMAVVPNILLSDLPYLIFGFKLIPAEFSSLLLCFIPLVIVIAVLRYRLWDIDLIIRASLLYGTLTVLLGAVYIILVSIFIALLGVSSVDGETSDNSIAVFFMSALLVAFLFTPARNYLQRLIDKIFFRNKLDYPHLITEFSRALTTSLLLDDLLNLLTHTIPDQLSLRGGKVLLNITTLPKNCVECKTLEQGRLIWLNRELHRNPSGTLPSPLDKLKQDGLWSCVPLLSGDNLMGIYGVGQKKSGEYYSREDIALLETVGRQAGVALQNAQLHKELSNQARIQRDLEIASQIQQRLLPRQDPKISGLEIVSYSRPAQEVGGDFHHYVKFSNEHIGVAVGDVSGKGVPAALFMAVSISTLRAEVPHHQNNVAALLVAMNDILFPQMSISDVNTAMLYATLEKHASSDGITLSVSNAGLIWPILRRSGRQVSYINVSGLPMGALPNVRYQTLELDLLPGDLVILSTDGIVEAMNRRKEMFGFERFEESIARCGKGLSATDVLETVIDDVFTFIGNAEPHDDMTLIAIRVV